VLGSRPNHGKGFAVRAGMLAGSGELLVFTDADGAYGPGDVQRVVQALETAPVAIGTRGPDTAAPLARQVASRAFNYGLHLLSDLPFADTQCGLKGFRRQAARQLFGRARACSGAGCGSWPTGAECSARSGRSARSWVPTIPPADGPVRSRRVWTVAALEGELLTVTNQTMQQSQASLWLRARPTAAGPPVTHRRQVQTTPTCQ
jgi:hypothetical protein